MGNVRILKVGAEGLSWLTTSNGPPFTSGARLIFETADPIFGKTTTVRSLPFFRSYSRRL